MELVCEEVLTLIKEDRVNDALAKIKEYNYSPTDCPELWTLKARCLERLGSYDDAFDAAYEVFKVSYGPGSDEPTCNVGILKTLADGHFRHGDYDLACDMYEMARDKCSIRAEINYLQDKYDKAEKKYFLKEIEKEKEKAVIKAGKIATEAGEVSTKAGKVATKSRKVATKFGDLATESGGAPSEAGEIKTRLHSTAKGKPVIEAEKIATKARKAATKFGEIASEFGGAPSEAGGAVAHGVRGAPTDAEERKTGRAATETVEATTGGASESGGAVDLGVRGAPTYAEDSETRRAATKDEKAATKTLGAPIKAAQGSSLEDASSVLQMEGGHDEEKNIARIFEPQKIEADLSISSNYELDTVQDGVYSGCKIIECIGIKRPKSFIKCLECQIKNYAELEYLGLNKISILKIDDVVDIEGSLYFAVEPVRTLQLYFSSERRTFFSNSQLQLADSKSWSDDVKSNILHKWWKFIEVKFKKIFSEIVEGLLFLDLKGYVCGSLEFTVYFTVEGNPRILPDMKSKITCGDDLGNLVKCMKAVVYQACPNSKVHPSWLQNDLNHLFRFLTPGKLAYVPLRWLLNHHLFWSPQQRVRFMYNLNRLKARRLLGGFSNYLKNVWKKEDVNYTWTSQIPSGILFEIYKKGAPESSSSPPENFEGNYLRVRPYVYPADVIRYMVAVYSHFNQSNYDEFRNEILDEVQIERKLTEVFPNIYIHLVDAFYAFVEDSVNGGMPHEEVNVLLMNSTP